MALIGDVTCYFTGVLCVEVTNIANTAQSPYMT